MALLAEIDELEKLELRKQELLMGKPARAMSTPSPKIPAPSPATTTSSASQPEPTPPAESPSDEEETGNWAESGGMYNMVCCYHGKPHIFDGMILCDFISQNPLRQPRKRSPLTTRGGFSSMGRSPVIRQSNSASGGTVLSERMVP